MIEQGSTQWVAQRLGKATASRVSDIIAKTKSGYSASRANYAAQLIAERLTGNLADSYKSPAMEWGTATEADARSAYEFYSGASVVLAEFVAHPEIAMSGASPDGYVGEDGLVEIKCPQTGTHIDTLLGAKVPGKYVTQIQWQLACTGRSWCDFASFDPRMPEEMRLFVCRVQRDDATIVELTKEVTAFLAEIDATVAALTKKYRHLEAAE